MKAVVLNPHDDDAIISIGGTLLKLIEKGWKIKYIQMTDGRHGSNKMSPEETKRVRSEEAEKERMFIGIDSFSNFDIEDGTLVKLSESELNELIQKTAEQIKDYEPDVIFIPAEFENHPDHFITYEIGHKAVKLLDTEPIEVRYVVWQIPFLQHNVKSFEKLLLVGIKNQFEKKLKGIQLHKSQEEEGRYSKMMEAMNKLLALLYTTYSPIDLQAAEVIALTNINDKFNLFRKDLEEVIDVTDVFLGRTSEKIKAE